MNYPPQLIKDLESKAHRVRETIVKVLTNANSWHLGGSLSGADIVTALYFHVMRHRPKDPNWRDRDRFILSKGHACSLLYTVLAMNGYFPEEELMNYRKPSSILQGHPDKTLTPGLEMSTGSLGQGLSTAVGMAIGGKLDKKDFRVFCMIGDGESHEGQIWEAAMAASHYQLDNLIGITDYNKCAAEARIRESMELEPLTSKWRAFGWRTMEVDGHSMEEIWDAFESARATRGKSTMIIAHTIKGKGVSFMEDQVIWHAKQICQEEGRRALEELKKKGPRVTKR